MSFLLLPWTMGLVIAIWRISANSPAVFERVVQQCRFGDILSRSGNSQFGLLDPAPRRTLPAREGFDRTHSALPAANRRNRTDGAWRASCGSLLETQAARRFAKQPSHLNVAPDAIAGAQRLRAIMRVLMRPDHIYLAMTMVKHSTLAVACIYAFKIVSFLVKTY
ncbi:MAG: hypothetical protein FJX40_05665 [Alphaproteobacteria bacterium]|nr:hypothetical protein [Alphaproteobacteria bacterium]MBM3639936.1 hypothetical protein [Alphaproteobacteria bacterium]